MNLAEVKDDYARKHGWENWEDLKANLDRDELSLEVHMEKVSMRYSRECCMASLDKAAENAEADYEYMEGHYMPYVQSDSITNHENITLL